MQQPLKIDYGKEGVCVVFDIKQNGWLIYTREGTHMRCGKSFTSSQSGFERAKEAANRIADKRRND